MNAAQHSDMVCARLSAGRESESPTVGNDWMQAGDAESKKGDYSPRVRVLSQGERPGYSSFVPTQAGAGPAVAFKKFPIEDPPDDDPDDRDIDDFEDEEWDEDVIDAEDDFEADEDYGDFF